MSAPILQVDGLNIEYQGRPLAAARDVSFEVRRGEIFGLVGETGSGKSTILRSIIGLLHRNARVESGAIRVAGHEVTGAWVASGPRRSEAQTRRNDLPRSRCARSIR